MAISNAVTLANFSSGDAFTIDSANDRVGVANTLPTSSLTVTGDAKITGVVTASSFVGDGANLTGVSGFATALSTDSSSLLNRIFKTPKQIDVGAGTSIKITSDSSSGGIAFCREGHIHVAVGGTFHVGSGTTFITNVLGVF